MTMVMMMVVSRLGFPASRTPIPEALGPAANPWRSD
jgi:hypothetical protein